MEIIKIRRLNKKRAVYIAHKGVGMSDNKGDKLNGIMGRLNRLMKDIDEYNKGNEDKIHIGMYVNYKGEEDKYNNRIYYYRNMDKLKMSELMKREGGVRKYVLSFNKVKQSKEKENSKQGIETRVKQDKKTEINKERKNDGKIIVLKDRANT